MQSARIVGLLFALARPGQAQGVVAHPNPADTSWLTDRHRPVPVAWTLCFLDQECRRTLPQGSLARIPEDSAAVAVFAHILRGAGPPDLVLAAADSAVALHFLLWKAPLVHRDLLLKYTHQSPRSSADEQDFMPLGVAIAGLSRYARTEPDARRRVLQLLTHGSSPWVRREAFHALLRLNSDWARVHIRRVPDRALALVDRELRAAVLATAPCSPDSVWNQCYGVEGQVYRGCGKPASLWRYCAF